MLEKPFRPFLQRLFVEPVAKIAPLSASLVTLLSALFGILVLPALLFNHLIIALVFLALSGYLDMLDGTLARLNNKSSPWGTALDIFCDRMVEFILILALFLVAPQTRGLYCLLMLGSILLCITSFLLVGIFTENACCKGFHYSPGLIERAEAFLFFAAMMLWPQAFTPLALIFTLLVLFTALIRLFQFYSFNSH